MDDNEATLVRLIYTRIGIIMEDASIIALDLGGPESAFDDAGGTLLAKAVVAIASLLDAADVMHQ